MSDLEWGNRRKHRCLAQGHGALCEKNNIGWSMWTTKKVNQNTNPYTMIAPPNYRKVMNAVTGGEILRQKRPLSCWHWRTMQRLQNV